jgi:hypothetical protein
MQTLVFNTTTKVAKLYEGEAENSTILFHFTNVPTVKVNENFYEVMVKDEFDKTYPTLRVPVSNTNMYITR